MWNTNRETSLNRANVGNHYDCVHELRVDAEGCERYFLASPEGSNFWDDEILQGYGQTSKIYSI